MLYILLACFLDFCISALLNDKLPRPGYSTEECLLDYGIAVRSVLPSQSYSRFFSGTDRCSARGLPYDREGAPDAVFDHQR